MTQAYWALITTVKHPVMAGRMADVQEAPTHPEEVRRSRSDEAVYLFYKPERAGRWTCVVAKRLNENGFLITTYPTDAIEEGERVWPR